ncbi:uncharacterized protein B0T15DRAFT_311515 [Chaetomium strumarium]|uniref:Uncharacterized protein n=1 Tax=Chaetomium strumarium TaxID=1170767 RepID=A0AAJ0GMD5_9PEZI|nr:hypothetical protein B0T15DRAFT_311515 [Chaetomium strumarium]
MPRRVVQTATRPQLFCLSPLTAITVHEDHTHQAWASCYFFPSLGFATVGSSPLGVPQTPHSQWVASAGLPVSCHPPTTGKLKLMLEVGPWGAGASQDPHLSGPPLHATDLSGSPAQLSPVWQCCVIGFFHPRHSISGRGPFYSHTGEEAISLSPWIMMWTPRRLVRGCAEARERLPSTQGCGKSTMG